MSLCRRAQFQRTSDGPPRPEADRVQQAAGRRGPYLAIKHPTHKSHLPVSVPPWLGCPSNGPLVVILGHPSRWEDRRVCGGMPRRPVVLWLMTVDGREVHMTVLLLYSYLCSSTYFHWFATIVLFVQGRRELPHLESLHHRPADVTAPSTRTTNFTLRSAIHAAVKQTGDIQNQAEARACVLSAIGFAAVRW